MKFLLVSGLILINYLAISQEIFFTRIPIDSGDIRRSELVYKMEIYNNLSVPICLPFSLDFQFTVDTRDTVTLPQVYSKDTAVYLSFTYKKRDIEGSSAGYQAVPVVLNPDTYMSTFIRIPQTNKHVYVVLRYSEESVVDYKTIRKSVEKDGFIRWQMPFEFKDQLILIK